MCQVFNRKEKKIEVFYAGFEDLTLLLEQIEDSIRCKEPLVSRSLMYIFIGAVLSQRTHLFIFLYFVHKRVACSQESRSSTA